MQEDSGGVCGEVLSEIEASAAEQVECPDKNHAYRLILAVRASLCARPDVKRNPVEGIVMALVHWIFARKSGGILPLLLETPATRFTRAGYGSHAARLARRGPATSAPLLTFLAPRRGVSCPIAESR